MDKKVVLEGEVVHGRRLGSEIGFPTANIVFRDESVEKGVYAVLVTMDGKSYRGVANIGKRPTVALDGELWVEVNIFGFDRDIYGKKIRVETVAFIRPEKKFDSVEDLKRAILSDVRTAGEIFYKMSQSQ